MGSQFCESIEPECLPIIHWVQGLIKSVFEFVPEFLESLHHVSASMAGDDVLWFEKIEEFSKILLSRMAACVDVFEDAHTLSSKILFHGFAVLLIDCGGDHIA